MQAPNTSRAAYVLLLFTMVFWGGNAIAGKLAVGHVSPMTLTALRWIAAFAILFVISWPQLRKDWPKVRDHLPLLFSYGVTGFALFNIALYSALNHTSAINVTIEQSGMPMVVILANFLLFKTRVTTAQILGFVMSITGVALTATNGDLGRLAKLDINQGDAIMLLAVLLYGGYSVALRYKPDLHWKSLVTVMSFAAMVTAIPFAIWEQQSGAGIVPGVTGLTIVAYTAIFPAIIAQIFYIRGVEMIGSNRASLFINLVPVFGTLLAIIILGETFRIHHALALALVTGGIWLAEHSATKAKKSGS